MKNQDNQVFNGNSADPFAKETESIENLIAKQSDTVKGFYDNEESSLIAELQNEYDNTEEVKTKSLEEIINLIEIIHNSKVDLKRLVKMIKLIKNDLKTLYARDIEKDMEKS